MRVLILCIYFKYDITTSSINNSLTQIINSTREKREREKKNYNNYFIFYITYIY